MDIYKAISPDHYDGLLEEMEASIGYPIEEWTEGDLYDFIERATGDKAEIIKLDVQMLLIRYTV